MSEPLIESFKLGNLSLSNRVVMTTIKLGYGSELGEVSEQHVAFYTRRALGGVGLMTTEPLYVLPAGREIPNQLRIDTDSAVTGLRRLTKAVHAVGGLMMAHLNHAGRAANPKLVPAGELVSASDVLCPTNQVIPRPLDSDEILKIISAFGAAARRARQAGFDAIEIPFSHGYLIHQFLSPHTNHREDEYGGSFENRLRFGKEIITKVQQQADGIIPIIVRINAKDYVKDGLEIEDAIKVAIALENIGVQAISVTSGTMCESVPFCLYPTGTPKANLLPMAARLRKASELPVIVAGRIRSPQVAREALQVGQTDLIGLARPLLADPDWVRKVESGDEKAILLCAACHQGCLAQLRKGEGTHCVFNPITGRESEIQIMPAKQRRKIMVIGGGPAGLEAAAVAAQRNHNVALFEQENHLGGQMLLASKAPHKEEFNEIIENMVLMAQRAGVDIRLGVQVTPEMVLNTRPDVVVIATGGIPLNISLPGLEKTSWMMAADLLDGIARVDTPTAFVIGGGLVGLESADFLAARGVQVTLVEMLPEVGIDMDILAKNVLLSRLKKQGVEIHAQTKVSKLTSDKAVARQGENTVHFPIETVVIAVGVRSNRHLAAVLEDSGLEMYIIGDAFKPRKALEAIWEGFEVSLKL
jgi:2,4-dienoyl-CoA reductase-like NADH-dependent reductase (Old Yellow Enzyme family)/thioredoxin reductase